MSVQKASKDKTNKASYKYCFVPHCRSTTTKTPGKTFIYVPQSQNIRKKWCALAGCPNKKLRPSSYICEDHFNLEEDLKNYAYWKTMGGPKSIRRDACPRFFACQADNPLPTALQRVGPPRDPLAMTEVTVSEDHSGFILPDKLEAMEETSTQPFVSLRPFSEEQFTQTKKTITASKGIQVKPPKDLIPKVCKVFRNASTSPIRPTEMDCSLEETFTAEEENPIDNAIDSKDFFKQIKIEASETHSIEMETLGATIFQSTTKSMIENDPLLFIGVAKHGLADLHAFVQLSAFQIEDVYLVMKKIKQNISNAVLSCYFGISESRIPDIFANVLPSLARFCRQFIVWPSGEEILLKAPKQLTQLHGEVESIVDFFEIEIDHQEDSQAIPKKRSTKYLISLTPDGMINYVSRGYTRLEPDARIVETSGYLDALPDGVAVLADQSLNLIETLLKKKKCALVPPPVVLSGPISKTISTPTWKVITSVKSHVDEILRGIRRFRMMESHSTVEDCLLPHLDNAVVVAAGLFNFQKKPA